MDENKLKSPQNVDIIDKSDFEFVHEFDKLGKSVFGQNQIAEYFGINGTSKKALDSGVAVLFYNSSDDFAVMLTTKDEDEVFLYKNSANKSFNNTQFIYAPS